MDLMGLFTVVSERPCKHDHRPCFSCTSHGTTWAYECGMLLMILDFESYIFGACNLLILGKLPVSACLKSFLRFQGSSSLIDAAAPFAA